MHTAPRCRTNVSTMLLVLLLAASLMLAVSCSAGSSGSDSTGGFCQSHSRLVTGSDELQAGYLTLFASGVAIGVEQGAFPDEVDRVEVRVERFGFERAEQMAETAEWELDHVDPTDEFVEITVEPPADMGGSPGLFYPYDDMAAFWLVIRPPQDVAPEQLNMVLFTSSEFVTGDDRDGWDWHFDDIYYDTECDLIMTRLPYLSTEQYPLRMGFVSTSQAYVQMDDDVLDTLLDEWLVGERSEGSIEERPDYDGE